MTQIVDKGDRIKVVKDSNNISVYDKVVDSVYLDVRVVNGAFQILRGGTVLCSLGGYQAISNPVVYSFNGLIDALLAMIYSGGVSSSYFKAEALLSGTPFTISASSSDQIVTGFTYTIPTGEDGDYVIHAAMTVDAGGTDNKPFEVMLAKNGVVITNSTTGDYMKKNEQQSIQITYPVDGLVATDIIAVYCNNDNIACDIQLGRMLIQSWT